MTFGIFSPKCKVTCPCVLFLLDRVAIPPGIPRAQVNTEHRTQSKSFRWFGSEDAGCIRTRLAKIAQMNHRKERQNGSSHNCKYENNWIQTWKTESKPIQSRPPVPLFQYFHAQFLHIARLTCSNGLKVGCLYSPPESHDGWACQPTWTAGFLKALQTESARRPWQRVVFWWDMWWENHFIWGKFRLPVTALCHLVEPSSFTAELGMLFAISICSVVATRCTRIHFVLVHPVCPPER